MSSIEEFIEGRPSAPNAFLAEGNENLPLRGEHSVPLFRGRMRGV